MALRLTLLLVAGGSLALVLVRADSPDRSSSGGLQKFGTQKTGPFVRPIRLKSETFFPAGDLDANMGYVGGRGSNPEGDYAIVQFHRLPDGESRTRLAALGIQILDYLPENAFFARLPKGVRVDSLRSAGVIWVGAVYAKDKLPPRMQLSDIGSWALQPDGSAELRVKYFQASDFARVARTIEALGGRILRADGKLREVAVILPAQQLDQLLACDGVRWVEEATSIVKPMRRNDGPSIVLPRGIFISGKFDLRLRDTPHSTLAQAFQGLIQQLLNGQADDIARTIFHSLGIGDLTAIDRDSRPFHLMDSGRPLVELF